MSKFVCSCALLRLDACGTRFQEYSPCIYKKNWYSIFAIWSKLVPPSLDITNCTLTVHFLLSAYILYSMTIVVGLAVISISEACLNSPAECTNSVESCLQTLATIPFLIQRILYFRPVRRILVGGVLYQAEVDLHAVRSTYSNLERTFWPFSPLGGDAHTPPPKPPLCTGLYLPI